MPLRSLVTNPCVRRLHVNRAKTCPVTWLTLHLVRQDLLQDGVEPRDRPGHRTPEDVLLLATYATSPQQKGLITFNP